MVTRRFAVKMAVKYRFFLVLEGAERGYRLVGETSLVSEGKMSHLHHHQVSCIGWGFDLILLAQLSLSLK